MFSSHAGGEYELSLSEIKIADEAHCRQSANTARRYSKRSAMRRATKDTHTQKYH